LKKHEALVIIGDFQKGVFWLQYVIINVVIMVNTTENFNWLMHLKNCNYIFPFSYFCLDNWKLLVKTKKQIGYKNLTSVIF